MSLRRERLGGGRTNSVGSGRSRSSTPLTSGEGAFERSSQLKDRITSIPVQSSDPEHFQPLNSPSPAPRPQTASSSRSASSAISSRSTRSARQQRPHTALPAAHREEGRSLHKSLQWGQQWQDDANSPQSTSRSLSRASSGSNRTGPPSSRARRPVSAAPDPPATNPQDRSLRNLGNGGEEQKLKQTARNEGARTNVEGSRAASPGVETETDRKSESGASATSSVVEERLVDFQKSFQDKNAAKFHLLSDCFRQVDTNKNGVLGREELAESMRKFDIEVDDRVIDRLMARCRDPDAMTMQEFKELLWVDQTMDSLFTKSKGIGAGGGGDNARSRYLWTPGKSQHKWVGTLNDALEAQLLQEGRCTPKLNLNFSSVQYDILTFANGPRIDPTVRVPLANRKRIFDPPASVSRRVAYDRGDTPFNVISLRSPRFAGDGIPTHTGVGSNAPVRLHTFARIHRGEYPTQSGHMLSKSVV